MPANLSIPTRLEVFQKLKAEVLSLPVKVDEALLSSGFSELDAALGGGFARGTIASLEGALSSGRRAIAVRMLAAASRTGFAAVIDDRSLFPPDLALAGVRLERLLVVPAEEPLTIAREADILLRSQAFGVLLAPAAQLKPAVWSRLAMLAQRADALLLILGGEASHELAYFASTRVGCSIDRVLWNSPAGLFCELAGYQIHTQVLKHKRFAPGKHARLEVQVRTQPVNRRETTLIHPGLRAVATS